VSQSLQYIINFKLSPDFFPPSGDTNQLEMTLAPVPDIRWDLGAAIWHAADRGDAGALRSLLGHPECGVSEVNFTLRTAKQSPLIRAIVRDSIECVRLLLDAPGVLINFQSHAGSTPLHYCMTRYSPVSPMEILKLVCEHPGINFNLPDENSQTPLWRGCQVKHLKRVEMLMALAPAGALDLSVTSRTCVTDEPGHATFFHILYEGKSAIQVARDPKIRQLILDYGMDAWETRRGLRTALGLFDENIAADFACTVLLCDAHLRLRAPVESRDARCRFFGVIARLPLELQMAVCHRRHGSPGDIICSRDTDAALIYVISLLL